VREWDNTKAALVLKRKRCHAIVRTDPSIDLESLTERLGVDERSVLRWRAELRNARGKSRGHNAPRRRPRRLL
jgi:hypothetical protein